MWRELSSSSDVGDDVSHHFLAESHERRKAEYHTVEKDIAYYLYRMGDDAQKVAFELHHVILHEMVHWAECEPTTDSKHSVRWAGALENAMDHVHTDCTVSLD